MSRIYPMKWPLALHITSLGLRHLDPAGTGGGIVNAFVVVRWNDMEVAKTAVVRNARDPSWAELDIDLKVPDMRAFLVP